MYGNFYSSWRGMCRLDSTVQARRDRAPSTWSATVSPTVQWQPSTSVTLALGPSLSRQKSDMFYVDQASTSTTPHYVVGAIDWTTVGLTTRLDVAFAPNLTFQLYAQPFLSAARYRDFKEVADPRAGTYANRFRRFTPALLADSYEADLDGDGAADVRFDDPAFNVKRFRSNAVLRWEYRPGSTVFVVWSQGRDAETDDGAFRLGRDAGDLFRAAPGNGVLAQWGRWLGPRGRGGVPVGPGCRRLVPRGSGERVSGEMELLAGPLRMEDGARWWRMVEVGGGGGGEGRSDDPIG